MPVDTSPQYDRETALVGEMNALLPFLGINPERSGHFERRTSDSKLMFVSNHEGGFADLLRAAEISRDEVNPVWVTDFGGPDVGPHGLVMKPARQLVEVDESVISAIRDKAARLANQLNEPTRGHGMNGPAHEHGTSVRAAHTRSEHKEEGMLPSMRTDMPADKESLLKAILEVEGERFDLIASLGKKGKDGQSISKEEYVAAFAAALENANVEQLQATLKEAREETQIFRKVSGQFGGFFAEHGLGVSLPPTALQEALLQGLNMRAMPGLNITLQDVKEGTVPSVPQVPQLNRGVPEMGIPDTQ